MINVSKFFIHVVLVSRIEIQHSGKSATIREKNHGSGVCKGALHVVLCTKKFHFVSRNWRKENKFCSMWVQLF